jgi:hypothetical protein
MAPVFPFLERFQPLMSVTAGLVSATPAIHPNNAKVKESQEECPDQGQKASKQ